MYRHTHKGEANTEIKNRRQHPVSTAWQKLEYTEALTRREPDRRKLTGEDTGNIAAHV